MEPSQRTIKVQKQITLTNEGYGFGFLVSPGREGGTAVESLIPNGVAWKDGKLRKGDKILTINGECVEKMDHQDVVKKLRLLNDEATNSITLCVVREEVSQGTSLMMKDHTEDTKLLSVNLQSSGPNSVGLTFGFDDSEHLIIEEIKPDGIAAKDGRLKVNDTVVQINGEAVSGKTDDDISALIKDIEESNGSMELLVKRRIPVRNSLQAHHKNLSRRKPKQLSSWSPPSLPKPDPIVKISLHNQGYGYGFAVEETEDKSIVVSTVFPEGVAHKDGRLRANDKLVEISGRKVSDMTYKEVVAMLRALNEDDHSAVDLKVERKV